MKIMILLIIIFLSISCEVTVVEHCDINGCTNEDALNYDDDATTDDGSCIVDNLTGSWTMSSWYKNTSTACDDCADDNITCSDEKNLWEITAIMIISGISYQSNALIGSVTITETDSDAEVTTYDGSCTLTQNNLTVTYDQNDVPLPTSYAIASDASTLTGNIVVADKCNQYTFTNNQ